MKKHKCCKCNRRLVKGTINQKNTLQRHHVLPKTFYHGRGELVEICQKCHKAVEDIYLKAERSVRGKRYKLEEWQYRQLFSEFVLSNRKNRRLM